MCVKGKVELLTFIDNYFANALNLDKAFGGYTFISPLASSSSSDCGATYTVNMRYVY